MKCPFLTLFLLVTSGFANASAPAQDFSQEPLVQRCMGMLDVYRDEDFDAYVAAFPEPWLGIFGEKVLKNELAARHQEYMGTYQGKPTNTIISGITPVEPAKIEKERLGAVEGKNCYFKYITSEAVVTQPVASSYGLVITGTSES
ncbi:hypothetical protein [Shewanella cyperi]|uniref:hypothetical protein n=1 Tax=Shewanella cyperi TaxID=2814292 RepID=UPI001A94EB51|nr:hypothetical protein [Shewanella cyperi]QSX40150.1 hypothetical protein JYB84_14395 [Shewanella cyperi]